MNKYIGLSVTYGASALTSIGLTVGGLTDAGSILITGSTAICAITGLGFGIKDFREALKNRDGTSASVKNTEADLEKGLSSSLTSQNLNNITQQKPKTRPETPSTEPLSEDNTPNKNNNDPTLKN